MATTDWKRDLVGYGAAYLLWAVTIALAVVAAALAREAYMLLLGVNEVNRYFIQASHNFLVLLLGLLVLAVVVFAEHHYRTAVPKGWLARRFFRLAAILVGLIALLHTVRLVLLFTLGAASSGDGLLAGGEWVVTLVLVWLAQWFRSRTSANRRA
jgi:hypothetical protein